MSSDLFFVLLATASKIIHIFAGFFDKMSVRFIKAGNMFFFCEYTPCAWHITEAQYISVEWKNEPRVLTKVTQLIRGKGVPGPTIPKSQAVNWSQYSPCCFSWQKKMLEKKKREKIPNVTLQKQEKMLHLTLRGLGLLDVAPFAYNLVGFDQCLNQNQK